MAPTEYPANLAKLLSLVARVQVEDRIGNPILTCHELKTYNTS